MPAPDRPGASRPRRSGLARNAVFQVVSSSALFVVSLLASPYLVQGLGVDRYGLLVLVGLTVNYLGTVELGLGQATVRSLAGHAARGEWEDWRAVFWTSAATYLVVGVAAAAALSATASFVATRVLRVAPPLLDEARDALRIAALALIVTMQVNVAGGVSRALERFDVVGRMTFWTGAVQAALSVTLLALGFGLRGVLLGSVLVQLGALAGYGWANRRLVTLGRVRVEARRLPPLIRFGAAVAVSQVVAPLLVHLEKALIGVLLGVGVLAYYAVPYSLAWALTAIPGAAIGILFPAFARLSAQRELPRQRELLVSATRYAVLPVLSCAVVLVIYAPEVLDLWMGAEFARRGAASLRVLGAAVVVNTLAWPAYQGLQGRGNANLTATYHLIELVIYVPLAALMILRLGLTGAALAWLVRVSIDTVLLVRAAARAVDGSARALVAGALGRPVGVAILLLPLALLPKLWIPHVGFAGGLVTLAGVGIAYAGAVFALALDGQEKRTLRGALMTRGRPAVA